MTILSRQGVQYQENHKNEDKGSGIIISLAIMLTMAYIAVGLRFTSRRMIQAKLSYDDWVIVIGLFLTSCFVAANFVLFSMGMGKHAILIQKPVPFAQAVLTTEVLYTPANTAIKFSILLLYRRLFLSKKFRNVLYFIAGFLVIFALVQLLSVIIQCIPVAALWNRMGHPNAHCYNYSRALIVLAIVHALTDIVILSLPMPILWHLNVNKTRREQLIGVFGLGGLVCAVSICRVAYVHQVSLDDPSWDDTTTVILSGVENCAGVFSACLPTMLPVWNYLHRSAARLSAKRSKLTPASVQPTGPNGSNMKSPLWSGSGKRDASIKLQDGPFQRLQEEWADELDDPQQPLPPMVIRVTTNIETSQKMAHSDDNHGVFGARQAGW